MHEVPHATGHRLVDGRPGGRIRHAVADRPDGDDPADAAVARRAGTPDVRRRPLARRGGGRDRRRVARRRVSQGRAARGPRDPTGDARGVHGRPLTGTHPRRLVHARSVEGRRLPLLRRRLDRERARLRDRLPDRARQPRAGPPHRRVRAGARGGRPVQGAGRRGGRTRLSVLRRRAARPAGKAGRARGLRGALPRRRRGARPRELVAGALGAGDVRARRCGSAAPTTTRRRRRSTGASGPTTRCASTSPTSPFRKESR